MFDNNDSCPEHACNAIVAIIIGDQGYRVKKSCQHTPVPSIGLFSYHWISIPVLARSLAVAPPPFRRLRLRLPAPNLPGRVQARVPFFVFDFH